MSPALPQLCFCSLIAALILDSVHRQQHDVLRHAYLMREVVSKLEIILPGYESAQPEDVPDFVPRGIFESDIPHDVLPLLDWILSEQVHGPDYHGPLPESS